MLIQGLAGAFTGAGFAEKDGRHPNITDADFHRGPVDVAVCDHTGCLLAIGRDLSVGTDELIIDGAGKLALPGFVDSHTHAAFAGDRSSEFFQRWQGRSYLELAKAGGGIRATQRQTRLASDDHLEEALAARLEGMRRVGTTTVEVKSGYGTSALEELRQLRMIARAAARVPAVRVVSTFLGLHSLPAGRSEGDYVDEMIQLLPLIRSESLATFVDSFPEIGFFSVEESLRFSEAAALLGFGIKAHADEMSDSGSSWAFLERDAVSIDHLQHASQAAMEAFGKSNTVATLLPATSFFLGLPYANARALLAAGAKVALASDYNPGTAPSADLRFTALLAAAQLRMSAAEILCALTFNAACALRLQNSVGGLTPGKSAFVLLVDAHYQAGSDAQTVLEHLILHGTSHTVRVVSGCFTGADG